MRPSNRTTIRKKWSGLGLVICLLGLLAACRPVLQAEEPTWVNSAKPEGTSSATYGSSAIAGSAISTPTPAPSPTATPKPLPQAHSDVNKWSHLLPPANWRIAEGPHELLVAYHPVGLADSESSAAPLKSYVSFGRWQNSVQLNVTDWQTIWPAATTQEEPDREYTFRMAGRQWQGVFVRDEAAQFRGFWGYTDDESDQVYTVVVHVSAVPDAPLDEWWLALAPDINTILKRFQIDETELTTPEVAPILLSHSRVISEPRSISITYPHAITRTADYTPHTWRFDAPEAEPLILEVTQLDNILLWRDPAVAQPLILTSAEAGQTITINGILNPLFEQGGLEVQVVIGDQIETIYLPWSTAENSQNTSTSVQMLIDGQTEPPFVRTASTESGHSEWELHEATATTARYGMGDYAQVVIAELTAEENTSTALDYLHHYIGQPQARGPAMQSFVTDQLIMDEIVTQEDGFVYAAYHTADGQTHGVVAVWFAADQPILAIGEQDSADLASMLAFVQSRPTLPS